MNWFTKWIWSRHKHDWRPARTSLSPCRVCRGCGQTDLLTECEFYAQFGRMAGGR